MAWGDAAWQAGDVAVKGIVLPTRSPAAEGLETEYKKPSKEWSSAGDDAPPKRASIGGIVLPGSARALAPAALILTPVSAQPREEPQQEQRWPAAAPPKAVAPTSLRESCEAAARGDVGSTVLDTEIQVCGHDGKKISEPAVYKTFEQCREFPKEVLAEFQKAGFPGPSQIQAYAWPLAVQGKDVIGIAATGSGKTLAFLLPSFIEFHKNGIDASRDGTKMLVLAPTRELAQQIEVEANRFGKPMGMWTCSMYGGAPKREQVSKYRQGVHCIVACPGRLNDVLESGNVTLDRVTKLVFDEADRMLDMGFEPQIRKILKQVPTNRHTMFFTATWPKDVRQLANEFLWEPVKVMIGDRDKLKANQDVTQQVRVVEQWDKKREIVSILKEAGLLDHNSKGKSLVFASTKRMCEDLSKDLLREGVACAAIHGDKDQYERDKALEGLKTGRIRVLVATDVAARGLDIKGVGLVVNFDVANNTEDYVHRIGRTGRAGAKGFAITLLTKADAAKARGMVEVMESTKQEISEELRALTRGGGWGGGGGNRFGGGKGGGGKSWGGGGGAGWGSENRGRSRSPRRW